MRLALAMLEVQLLRLAYSHIGRSHSHFLWKQNYNRESNIALNAKYEKS